tara:strand:- start:103 stop:573 length:471 start_codon:yes stop_codon:yes gene_type:complete
MKIDGTALGLRFIALIIDYSTAFGVFAGCAELTNIMMEMASHISVALSFALLPIPFLAPILYLGIPTGLKGKTLGKWICRLRVCGSRQEKIGIIKGCGREAFKALLVFTNIGAIISLIFCFTRGQSLHDMACSTDVEYQGNLTQTQKNWRKAHGNY